MGKNQLTIERMTRQYCSPKTVQSHTLCDEHDFFDSVVTSLVMFADPILNEISREIVGKTSLASFSAKYELYFYNSKFSYMEIENSKITRFMVLLPLLQSQYFPILFSCFEHLCHMLSCWMKNSLHSINV